MQHPLNLSAMTHCYPQRDRLTREPICDPQTGEPLHRLDMARITASPGFDDFSQLADYVLETLRYPRDTPSKLWANAWVPTLYSPSLRRLGDREVEGQWRLGEHEASRLSCMYCDIDNTVEDRPQASEAGIADRLAEHLGAVAHFTYTSWSSTEERRKFRLVFDTSRPLTRGEMLRSFIWLNEVIFDHQGDGSIYDPGDMLFAPPHRSEITRRDGGMFDVDAVLALQAAMPDAPALLERYTPGLKRRTASAPRQGAARAWWDTAIDPAVRPDFTGIHDPQVFNPAWREDARTLSSQGSHYATMLTLLGRVWRKTNGALSGGEMLRVFAEIDALWGGYMADHYEAGKAEEMVSFVIAQPVEEARPTHTYTLRRRLGGFRRLR